ncbi:hypothetical protein [Rhodospirillum centenum]|uniref:Uncharacterized protein n=1 Tax=Rhodospirillum centenum (strain ATCC 51521 / SW) TaxID=414684 RepID=B6IUB5_RHOCS|nr:hypothetical protein [Rhodospirillum centenum]ACJ00095.1 hypothetical protein RC1_2720 [Rhodospirillum centenum SW]
MSTNAEIAARLLRDAAEFFRHVGDQNAPIRPQMDHNARAFEAVADLVETDPTAEFETEGQDR